MNRRKKLAAWMLGDLAELAELVVTNALRHGTGPIDISLSSPGDNLAIEVHDHGVGRPYAGKLPLTMNRAADWRS